MENEFVELIFKRNKLEEKYDEEKKIKIKNFLKEQFQNFISDDGKRISEEYMRESIKKELKEKDMKSGHIMRVLRTLYSTYVEILIKKNYPNIPINLKEYILENSYIHRLNEKKLDQLKLFIGDKEEKINIKKREIATNYLIKNWDNPEFYPFFSKYEDAMKKLGDVKDKRTNL